MHSAKVWSSIMNLRKTNIEKLKKNSRTCLEIQINKMTITRSKFLPYFRDSSDSDYSGDETNENPGKKNSA